MTTGTLPAGEIAAPLAPPANVEAERSVLGAVLLSERAMFGLVAEEGLRPAQFYRRRHELVFAAMLRLYDANEPIDVLTLVEQLRRDGTLDAVGGPGEIDGLAGGVPAAGNARHYARIVRDAALDRQLMRACYAGLAAAAEGRGDVRDRVDALASSVFDLSESREQGAMVSAGEALSAELERLQQLAQRGSAITGVPSGMKDLDELTAGIQPGNLVVIAGRPGMGKSAIVTNIAEHAALHHQIATAIFSLEMSQSEISQRLLASNARVDGDKLRRGAIEQRHWPALLEAGGRFARAPLHLYDGSDLQLVDLRAKARRLHAQTPGGLGLVIVDYLQLLRSGRNHNGNRVDEVSEISRELKALALELNVPVIALSSLSRAVEQRPDKRPQLSDLRESGQIESDADLVIFLYREDYYNADSEREGEADLIIAKHRNGPNGRTVAVVFDKPYAKFRDMAAPHHRDR